MFPVTRKPFLYQARHARERLHNFFEHRRTQRNLAVWMLIFLTVLVGTELLFPKVSVPVGIMGFMVLYVLFLTALLVYKRFKARRHGIDLESLHIADQSTPPTLEVIIAAHNEINVIEATVHHFMALLPLGCTLRIMNDRSTDGTRQVLDDVWLNHPEWHSHLAIVHRPEESVPGKSAVLNDALALSEAPVLAIFDADARIDADFIPTMFSILMEDDSIAAVQARKVIENASFNRLTQCQHWEYTFDAHLQWCRDLAGSAVELRGNGFLVKRKALDDVNGFNEASITDDLDLSTRLHLKGWLIRFTPHTQVFEEGVTEFKALIHQRRRWAEGSLRRYLDFGGAILFSGAVSFRTRLDMMAYWVNFLFPILISLELIVVGVSTLFGQAERIHQLMAISMVPMFALAFIPTLYTSIRRFDRPKRWYTVQAAITTGIYMTMVWFPVVFLSFGKVLFKPNAPFKWSKTAHGSITSQHSPSIGAFTPNQPPVYTEEAQLERIL